MNPAPEDIVGRVIGGRYRVERLIGQGGMGSVWVARHLTLDKRVAVKVIHRALATSTEAQKRFEVEARAAARIKSRHAVEVYDHGVDGDLPYIVMECLEGESLDQALRRRGALPLSEVMRVVRQVATALELAHEAGVVHRDLKPDNIFLARDGESSDGYTVKVVDFGIAKLLLDNATGESTTQAGTVLGTPHYMSPEALTGSEPVSPASDIWSLGACAFVAACNRIPFPGDVIGEVVMRVCAAPLPVPSRLEPALPREFDLWFARACARDPRERFGSVRELSDALQHLDSWSQQERENSSYALVQGGDVPDSTIPRQGGRALVLGGALAGAAATIGALGYFALQQKLEAQEAINRTAASAAAIIEADNRRKLAEADRHFWAQQGDGGAATDAGTDAGVRKAQTAKKRK